MQMTPEQAYRAAEKRLVDEYQVEVDEHFIEVASPKTRVRVLSVGEGPPVLFLHGSPNCAASWLGLAAELKGFRCLLLDCPGAGLSSPVDRWGDHRLDTAAIVCAVLDTLGLDKVDVVGSSLGGLYGFNVALRHPDRVRSLTLMGCPTGPEVLPIPPFERILALPIPVSLFLAVFRPSPKMSRKMFADIGHGPSIEASKIPDAMFDWYLEVLRHTPTMSTCVEEVRVIESVFGRKHHARVRTDELASLGMSVLYLWGDADPMAKPEHGDALAALTPGARIEHFAGFGHLPWLDDLALIASRLSAFLQSPTPSMRDAV